MLGGIPVEMSSLLHISVYLLCSAVLSFPILPLHRVRPLELVSLPSFTTLTEFLTAVQVPLTNYSHVCGSRRRSTLVKYKSALRLRPSKSLSTLVQPGSGFLPSPVPTVWANTDTFPPHLPPTTVTTNVSDSNVGVPTVTESTAPIA